MTKSELIERIVTQQGLLSSKDVELAIKTMLEQMAQALATGDRIEIRGFGSFSLHYRAPRVGRNPRSEEHTSELQSLMRSSYAVFCLKKKNKNTEIQPEDTNDHTLNTKNSTTATRRT